MAALSLDHEFLQYWSNLTIVQKESLLKVVKSFVEDQNLNIEEYNREIDDAVQRFESGLGISHEEVERMAKDW